MKHKINLLFIFSIICFCLCSCVSNHKIIKNSDFCGVVVDENNNPIPNFLVKCSKSNLYSQTAITNNSGIFLFPQMESGVYKISGSKDNFVILEEQEFYFNDNSSLFCCQIRSFLDVIESIDSLIENKEYEKGVLLLDKVKFKENSFSQSLYFVYKAYLSFYLGKMDIYAECISELKKSENDKCKYFIKKMEMKNYEKQ